MIYGSKQTKETTPEAENETKNETKKPDTNETRSEAKKSESKKNDADTDELLSSAMGFLGVAYRFGGTTTAGFDCSGFIQYVFKKTYAVNLPRTSSVQATVGTHVDRAHLQKGDLVFFNTRGNNISHVGMYVGNNRFIHAPRTGKRIEITDLSNKYWNSKYVTARRIKKQMATYCLKIIINQLK